MAKRLDELKGTKTFPREKNLELSSETEAYLHGIQERTIKSSETKKKEAEKKEAEEKEKRTLLCPTCRKHNTLKRDRSGSYSCGYCGLTTPYPLVAEKK